MAVRPNDNYWQNGQPPFLIPGLQERENAVKSYAETLAAEVAAARVSTSDPRLTDARVPLAHSHAQADVTGLSAALAALASKTALPFRNVMSEYGALGNGSTDDRGAIQAALNAGPGIVWLPPTVPAVPGDPSPGYAISAPLAIPSGVRLVGSHRPQYLPVGSRPTFLRPTAGFTGNALITMTNVIGAAVEGVCIWGGNGVRIDTSTEIELRDVEVMNFGNGIGIRLVGAVGNYVQDVRMTNVHCWTNISTPVGVGIQLDPYVVDCDFHGVIAHHCTTGILVGTNNASHSWTDCRAEWCSGSGYVASSADNIRLKGFSTDRCSQHGIFVQAGAVGGPMQICDALLRRDGRAGSAGTPYSAIRIADTATVQIDNVAIRLGPDDGGGGTVGPQRGIHVSGTGSVVLAQGTIAGVFAPFVVDSGSYRHSGGSFLNTNGSLAYAAPSTS